MIRLLQGAFLASLALILWHVKLRHIVYKQFQRGDESDYGDVCKQPTWRYYSERLRND